MNVFLTKNPNLKKKIGGGGVLGKGVSELSPKKP